MMNDTHNNILDVDPEDLSASDMTPIPMDSPDHGASLSMADVNIMDKSERSGNSHTFPGEEEEEDISSSFPSPEELRAVNHNSNNSNNKKRTCLWICVPLVLIVGLVVGLAVGFTVGEEEGQARNDVVTDNNPGGNNNPAPVPVPAPAPAPTPAPAPRATLNEIVDWLVAQQVSSRSALLDPGSPQQQAAEWLAAQDEAALALPPTSVTITVDDTDETDSGYFYMVRYVMAVTYYALNGENWPTQVNFLSPDPVCDWHGLSQGVSEPFVGAEVGGLLCDDVTGVPVILDLGKCRVVLCCVVVGSVLFYCCCCCCCCSCLLTRLLLPLSHTHSHRIQRVGRRTPHRTGHVDDTQLL